MRLWHKDLIKVLPRQQLLGQWRECCLIAKNIEEKGSPNHLLVNKIIKYPIQHFVYYTSIVYDELIRRGYKPDIKRFRFYADFTAAAISYEDLFSGWHTYRYFKQCFYNLQEKHDCGGITDEEWVLITTKIMELG